MGLGLSIFAKTRIARTAGVADSDSLERSKYENKDDNKNFSM